jgi:hypothetical protein
MAAGADDARKWWIVVAVSLVLLPLVIDFYGIVVARVRRLDVPRDALSAVHPGP